MVHSEKRISLTDFLTGLELDEVYSVGCHTLLHRYAVKHHLKIDDSAPVPECLRVLLGIWVEHEHLPLYHHGGGDRVVFNVGTQSKDILSGRCFPDYEIDKNDLERFFRRSRLPLPAPAGKEEDPFWFHGNLSSTECHTLESLEKVCSLELKKKQEVRSRTIAKMAIVRRPKNLKDSFRDYPRQLNYILSKLAPSIDRTAAAEWYRYFAIKNECDKIENQKHTDEFLVKCEKNLRKEMLAIRDWMDGKRDIPTEGNPEVLEKFPTSFFEVISINQKQDKGQFFVPSGTEWYDIKMDFVNETNINITVGRERTIQRNYKSIGCFYNKRSKKQRKAWFHLLALAVYEGNPPAKTKGSDLEITTKNVTDLQKALKHLFPDVDGAPFEGYARGTGWKPRISLSLSKGFSEQCRI